VNLIVLIDKDFIREADPVALVDQSLYVLPEQVRAVLMESATNLLQVSVSRPMDTF
jgi:hypothetical protein